MGAICNLPIISNALSFYRSQNVLRWSKLFVPDQKFIYILWQLQKFCARQKDAFSKIGFCASTKVFEEALNAVKFLGWLKNFGPAQNILGPVKGQGITQKTKIWSNNVITRGFGRYSFYLLINIQNRTMKKKD